MKVNLLIALVILTLFWPTTALWAAVSKTTWPDAPATHRQKHRYCVFQEKCGPEHRCARLKYSSWITPFSAVFCQRNFE